MIFISHTHSDKEFVNKLVNDLNRWHFDLWFSTWELKPGESITEKVTEALTESDCLIVVLSKKSCEADWVKREVSAYLKKTIEEKHGTIIPVMIEECSPNIFIQEFLQLRLHEIGYEALLTELVFELVRLSKDNTGNKKTIDVFSKINPPITSKKQFIKRLNDEISNPLRIDSKYVILNDNRKLWLLPNSDVKCEITLDILLCKEDWDSSDWRDTLYDSIEIPTIKNVGYKTNSQITGTKYDEDSKSLIISWQPEKKIRPGKSYKHTFEFLVRKGFTAPTNYWVHRTYNYPTLWSKVEIFLNDNIEEVITCRPPFTFELIEPWEFIAYSIKSMDTFNSINKTRKKLKIELSADDMLNGLLVSFLAKGWQEYHLNEKNTDGSEERKQIFDQSWYIEERFREKLGWKNVNFKK